MCVCGGGGGAGGCTGKIHNILWGLIVKDPYMNRPLYSSYLSRLIILILLNFWLVVRVASGKINFVALLRR